MNDREYWEKRITELYAVHARAVWKVCLLYMRDPYDADDISQETFLKVIEKRPQFADAGHERGWLIMTASNLCKDALRSKERQHEAIEDHQELQADDMHEDDLLPVIMSLPDKMKTPLYLYYYEGYKTGEIAKLMGISEVSVRINLYRARKKLKKLIGGSDEG